MFEKYIPPKIFYKRYENASETEKAEIDEAKKEVRAKITKLIGELSAVLDKRSAILDDESKNREDKIKALLELRKENPDASDILYVTFTQFLPKNNFFGKSERKPLDELDKEKWKKLLKEIVANTTKLIGELNAAMDKQIAIIDDKSKTFKEKGKALWELREENPKVYKVLGAVYEQFTPKLRHLCKIYKKLNDNEKAKLYCLVANST
ncbi:unnamed protein product [Cylicostephanus goldi]|uniref:SXP/RAL-2 family protein Ani s 5-like cation-binding domain-containing protein n=1 Tax=Cylicostephanus goldi TaxID=71465 RepID=A0A3P6RQ27_CYLGO|nr:unnamed protein product [Cylicostephanus goldi]